MGNVSFDEENDGDIIKAIQDGVRTETIKVAPDEFLTREVHLAPLKPLVAAMAVASLSALAEYINAQVDSGMVDKYVIQIKDPTTVVLWSQMGDREDRRFGSVKAEADVPKIPVIGEYQSQELAMIQLQSLFVQEGRVEDVLRSIGNIVLDEEINLEDDGVTQRVALQSGIERKFADIVNPVALKPFRTFTEVGQPESPFVLRLKKDSNNKLFIALFEADGGKWRNAARENIKAFLKESITTGEVPILA